MRRDHQFGPQVAGAALCRAMAQMRKSALMSQQSVATALRWSYHKYMRMETGLQRIKPEQLESFLVLVKQQGTVWGAETREWCAAALEKGWWSSLTTDSGLGEFVGMEYAARRRVHLGDPILLPELLRHPKYHAWVNDPDEVELLEARRRRTQETTRDVFLVWESSLHKRVGRTEYPGLRREQLEMVMSKAGLERSELRVVPINSDHHPLIGPPMTLMEFGLILPERVYVREIGFLRQGWSWQDGIKGEQVKELVDQLSLNEETSLALVHKIWEAA